MSFDQNSFCYVANNDGIQYNIDDYSTEISASPYILNMGDLDGNIMTVMYYLLERKKNFGNENVLNGTTFKNSIPSLLEKKIYNENVAEIGKGYNAIVSCCILLPNINDVVNKKKLESLVFYKGIDVSSLTNVNCVIKIPKHNNTTNYLEYKIYEDLVRIKFNVLPIFDVGTSYEFLIKPHVDAQKFADKLNGFTELQKEKLHKLYLCANRYTLTTGIPLDMKPDNIWWDDRTNDWYLIDTGARLDNGDVNKFGYTLRPTNFEEYFTTYFINKSPEGILSHDYAIPRIACDSYPLNHCLKYNSIVTINYNHNYVNYKKQVERLHAHLLSSILKLTNIDSNNRIKINLIVKAFGIDYTILQHLQFSKKYVDSNPNVMKIYDFINNNQNLIPSKILKEYFQKLYNNYIGIVALYNDTNKFLEDLHKSNSPIKIVEDGLNSIQKYTGSDYIEMNNALLEQRDTLHVKDNVGLQQFLLYPNLPKTTQDIILHRSINALDNVKKDYENIDKNTIIENLPFASTSTGSVVISGNMFLEIHIPKGTPVLFTIAKNPKTGKTLSNIPNEEEIILPAGLPLEYTGCNYKTISVPKNNNFPVFVYKCATCPQLDLYTINNVPNAFKDIPKIKNQQFAPTQAYDKKVGLNRIYNSVFNWYYNGLVKKKPDNAVRLMTWNVHEWTNKGMLNKKGEMIDAICDQIKPDVLSIQESTSSNVGNLCKKNHRLDFVIQCDADQGNSGQLRNSVFADESKFKSVTSPQTFKLGNNNRCGSSIILEHNATKIKFAVVNVHLEVTSSAMRKENIQKLLEHINAHVKQHTNNIFIMGDFNSYMKEDYNPEQMKDLEKIKTGYGWPDIFDAVDLLRNKGYEDIIKKIYGEDYNKHIPINTNQFGGRIDFIFVNKENALLNNVKTYTYYNSYSDHIPIIADIVFDTTINPLEKAVTAQNIIIALLAQVTNAVSANSDIIFNSKKSEDDVKVISEQVTQSAGNIKLIFDKTDDKPQIKIELDKIKAAHEKLQKYREEFESNMKKFSKNIDIIKEALSKSDIAKKSIQHTANNSIDTIINDIDNKIEQIRSFLTSNEQLLIQHFTNNDIIKKAENNAYEKIYSSSFYYGKIKTPASKKQINPAVIDKLNQFKNNVKLNVQNNLKIVNGDVEQYRRICSYIINNVIY